MALGYHNTWLSRHLASIQDRSAMSLPFVRTALSAFGLDPAKRRERHDRIPEATAEDEAVLAIAARYSMSGRLRHWSLLQSVRYVVQKGIEGDIVECGVWKGGNLILCGLALKALGASRRIWGFDTFEGMSEPGEADHAIGKTEPAHLRWRNSQRDGVTDWSYAPYAEVERNYRAEVGDGNLTLVKGKVEDTLDRPENVPGTIAILRLDTDWYDSTKKELEVLYPRLQRGGLLVVDDYGHWAGAKKAVNEYFAGDPILLQRIDYTARVHVKV
jgi:hypothetical protein